jgi:AcrR family transcriptional regulator
VTFQPFDSGRIKLVHSARLVFLQSGYDAPTMSVLAAGCGLTRRGLYHHFKSKEDLFRALLQVGNVEALEAGDKAAHAMLASGGAALDVIATWLDTRFGTTRRSLGASPHAKELNDTAFRVGTDIMIEVSYASNRALAILIAELQEKKLLRLGPGVTAERAARLVADGARGVNQMRPPIPNSQIAQSYREITEAILYGCAIRR